jgi:hypothetical protein
MMPDEESAGIQASAGPYKSERLCKLGILEEAQKGWGIVAPPVQSQLDFALKDAEGVTAARRRTAMVFNREAPRR